jgi:hypothetical protein
LRDILVRRADDYPFGTRISIGQRCCCEIVIRFELNHWPHNNAGRGQNFFEQRELCQKVGFDAFFGFVGWSQINAKRFDAVIGRNRDVRSAGLHHAQN